MSSIVRRSCKRRSGRRRRRVRTVAVHDGTRWNRWDGIYMGGRIGMRGEGGRRWWWWYGAEEGTHSEMRSPQRLYVLGSADLQISGFAGSTASFHISPCRYHTVFARILLYCQQLRRPAIFLTGGAPYGRPVARTLRCHTDSKPDVSPPQCCGLVCMY